ncbi:hypothetical protein ACP70R_041576 [Stipagrostis hirtigluma subsp. patula]
MQRPKYPHSLLPPVPHRPCHSRPPGPPAAVGDLLGTAGTQPTRLSQQWLAPGIVEVLEETTAATMAIWIDVVLPPVRTEEGGGDGAPGNTSAARSPCSVDSDCNSVASTDLVVLAEGGSELVPDDQAAVAETPRAVLAGAASKAVDCVLRCRLCPGWGLEFKTDAAAAVPQSFCVLTGAALRRARKEGREIEREL